MGKFLQEAASHLASRGRELLSEDDFTGCEHLVNDRSRQIIEGTILVEAVSIVRNASRLFGHVGNDHLLGFFAGSLVSPC